jgi:hypothetical protein
LVGLCGDLELPFPAEPKRPYSTWWHSLHEIGHWAVKPSWYLGYSNWMRDDIVIRRGHLHIPANTIPGVGEIERLGYLVYGAGNDLIPDISLLRDPTAGEWETRVWSLLVIQHLGWPHPLDENKRTGVVNITSGDEAFHKAASARVWFREQVNDPTIACSMAQWGLDPARGLFRAKGHGFLLPYPRPRSFYEIVGNMDAIYRRYRPDAVTSAERHAWIEDYLFPRFMKKFL